MAVTPTPSEPKILLVDDDPEIHAIIKTRLDASGYQFISALTGGEFYTHLKKEKPQLVIIDLNLGESAITGFELIEFVRQQLGKKIPILVMSGNQDSASLVHAIELGADDYMIKPPLRNLFLEKIQILLKMDQVGGGKYLHVVPEAHQPCKIVSELKVESVDEYGVKIQGAHLLPKNLVFQMEGAFLSEVTGSQKPLLMTVVNNWAVTGQNEFGAYAEFSVDDPEVLSAVKRWLLIKKQSTGKLKP